jgi:hypothetical protein
MGGRAGGAGLLLGLNFFLISGPASAQIPLDNPDGGPPYLGLYELGLYRDGSNECPEAHRIEGLARANAIAPLNSNGNPDPNGRIVMLSIGMSNTTIPFCTSDGSLPPAPWFRDPNLVDCYAWTFMGRARDYAAISPLVQIVNGAYIGQASGGWDDDNFPTFNPIPPNPNIPPVVGNYDRIRDMILPEYIPAVTEASVQIVWLKLVNDQPLASLPNPGNDAELLMLRTGNALRLMKARYPNLSIVFITSSTYRGYHTGAFNPEPEGYESGFAIKWLIDAQITQIESNNTIIHPIAGDLDYTADVVPWIVWGPYLWANGPSSRSSDGLSWVDEDYSPDGVHHEQPGLSKFAIHLLSFFTQSRFSHCWFIGDGACE